MELHFAEDEWGFKVDGQGRETLIVPKKEFYTRSDFNAMLGAIDNLRKCMLQAIDMTDPK